MGVLGAVSLATACALEGSPAHEVAAMSDGNPRLVSVEHPSGGTSVELDLRVDSGTVEVRRSALLRTARRLFEGRVFVPATTFGHHGGQGI